MENLFSVAVVALSGATLAVVALSPLIAKRTFPSFDRASDAHPFAAVALVAAAGLVLFPVPPLSKVFGVLLVLGVIAVGRWIAYRKNAVEPCNCFGAITPQDPRFYLILFAVTALAGAIVIAAALKAPQVFSSPASVLLAAVGAAALHFALRYKKYQQSFYNPGKLEGVVPESIEADAVLGLDDAGQPVRVVTALRGRDVLLIVSLSSSCASCYEEIKELTGRLEKTSNPFPIAFVSDSERMFKGLRSSELIYHLIDPQMSMAKRMLAPQLPMAFPLNDKFEVVAPPCIGNASINSLVEIIEQVRAGDE